MSAQLELQLARRTPSHPRITRQRALAAGRALLAWTPVWVPLLFLGQLIVLGLWPGRAEAQRLDRAEAEVRARVETLEREESVLKAEARMLEDGVYQERVRRSLLDPTGGRLTLERARTGSKP